MNKTIISFLLASSFAFLSNGQSKISLVSKTSLTTIDPTEWPMVYSIQSENHTGKFVVNYDKETLLFLTKGVDSVSISRIDTLDFEPYDVFYEERIGFIVVRNSSTVDVYDPSTVELVRKFEVKDKKVGHERVLASYPYIVFGNSYPFEQYGNGLNRVGIDVVDIEKDSIVFSYRLKDESKGYLGYMNKRYFEVSNGHVFIADPTGVNLYDIELGTFQVDSIGLSLQNDCFDEIKILFPDTFLLEHCFQAKRLIEMLRNDENNGVGSCEHVLGIDYIGNNTMAVFTSIPGKDSEKAKATLINTETLEIKKTINLKLDKTCNPYYTEGVYSQDGTIHFLVLENDNDAFNYSIHSYVWE